MASLSDGPRLIRWLLIFVILKRVVDAELVVLASMVRLVSFIVYQSRCLRYSAVRFKVPRLV
jgi:hypothetical protein